MRKKLYFLINSLEGGGAERVTVNISQRLSQDNDITIITLKDVNFYDLPSGVRHIPLSGVRSNILMFLLIPWYVLRLKKILRREKFDSGVSFLEIANFIHILARKDAIISFRIHISFFVGIVGFFYKTFISILYPKARKIIVNSEENKYDLSEYLNMDERRIEVLYNPIDFEKIEAKKLENIPEDLQEKIRGKKIFITVGRLVWQKHHRKLINAFKRAYDEIDKDWIYLIIGDGPERGVLEKQTQETGLGDYVLFLGAQKNVFKYLNISDYFLYASEVEGFPNVLIEAMACGLPTITSDFKSGARECVLGEYDKNLIIENYPYNGPNGVLLGLNDFERGFVEVYKKTCELKQKKEGFERFDMETTQKTIEALLS